MFVTTGDFDGGDYNLPVSVDSPTALMDLIVRKEKYFLKKVLGVTLYNEFVAALFVDPNADPLVAIAENLIPQKWKDLRDGITYEIDGETYTYGGVRGFLIPLIAAEWWDDNASQISSFGESEPVVENSTVISPASRIAKYWNDGIALIGSYCEKVDSLYGFLSVTYEVDYQDWQFTDLETINDFDL